MKTGFIGLGAMGEGMAKNVAKQGLLTSVYNRTSQKAVRLAEELNVDCCDSIAALTRQSDIILLCVSADEDVLDVVEQISLAVKPGSVIVDMSTVSMEAARQAAQILRSRQADFLDAPVSGGTEGAKNGTLAMMVGGSEQALEKARPVLETMTSRITHMGDTGSGQATKAVNQIMAAGINQAVTEALAFGQAQGLEMDNVIQVISGGAAGNWFLQHRGPSMTKGIFKPGFKVALHAKDLKICQQMAEQAGLDLPLTQTTLDDYQQLMEQGFADEDISALYRLKKK